MDGGDKAGVDVIGRRGGNAGNGRCRQAKNKPPFYDGNSELTIFVKLCKQNFQFADYECLKR